jgi:hypothetical protein
MLYYLVPLFFLIAAIFYLGGHYWQKRNPKTAILLASLVLGVGLAVTQFFIGPMKDHTGGNEAELMFLSLLIIATLPRGLLIGFLMGLITNTIRPLPLLLRIVCPVIIGAVLFIVLGGFLFWPNAVATSAVLGALMGFLLGILQAILLAYTTTKDSSVDDIKLLHKGSN